MSTSSVFAIFPNDTLFFRDGTPFNQDDAGLAEARSVFPPYPPVVAGALRAGMARTLGWPGWGNWQGNSSIVGRLGSGQNMCCLQFNGPFLARVSDEQQNDIADAEAQGPGSHRAKRRALSGLFRCHGTMVPWCHGTMVP